MARVTFTPQEWRTIDRSLDAYLASDREPFGLPEHRDGSVVLGTFNIRELGACSKRSPEAWEFLRRTCERFDLLAVQEVQDDLSGIQRLRDLLGGPFELVVSDTTGKTPGRCGCPERLAFLHRSSRVRQTELASDISFDRTDVVSRLFERRDEFARTWAEHQAALDAWKTENERRVAEGKRRTSKPAIRLPTFLTFIRQPHCASFEVMPTPGDLACPLGFLIVNAHLHVRNRQTGAAVGVRRADRVARRACEAAGCDLPRQHPHDGRLQPGVRAHPRDESPDRRPAQAVERGEAEEQEGRQGELPVPRSAPEPGTQPPCAPTHGRARPTTRSPSSHTTHVFPTTRRTRPSARSRTATTTESSSSPTCSRPR